jgi:succinoglycan biosynthesis transport protein ExoP
MGRSARDVSLHEIVYVVFKRRHSIIGIFLVVVIGVLLAIMLSPRGWEATATLLLKRERGDVLVTPQAATPVPGNARLQLDEDVRSEAELVKRRSLLAQVVTTFGPEAVLSGRLPGSSGEPPAPDALDAFLRQVRRTVAGLLRPITDAADAALAAINTKAPMSRTDQAIAALDAKIKVTAVDNSNLVKVAFNADDGRFATGVLDTMMKRYLEEYARLRSAPGTADFFREERDRFARELRVAEQAAEGFARSLGVTPLNRERELYLSAAFETANTMQTTEAEIQGLREKSRALREQIAAAPERIPMEEESRVNPSLDRMRAKLLDLEAERNKVRQKYLDSDRRVTDIDKEIAALRDKAAQESEWEVARTTVGENKLRQQLVAQLVETDTQLLRAETKSRGLAADQQRLATRLRTVDSALYERQRHDRALKMAEDGYLLYAKKYEEARISKALDDRNILNVTLAEPVQVAPKPGRAAQLGGLGIVAGLVLGVAVAFIREFFGNSFTTVESVRRHLRLPVVATIADRAR